MAGAGTLFIERGQRHAVHAMGESMQARFRQGDAVGLFPEGTTSEGSELRPFMPACSNRPARPPSRSSPWPCASCSMASAAASPRFIGDESLVANLWRVMGTTGLSVEVVFLPPLATRNADGSLPTRLELSHQARDAIQQAL